MQVYEGINHIASVVELTNRDFAELQISVGVLVLQKRDKTAKFVREYADSVVKYIQSEAEAVDNNDLELYVVFPLLNGSTLKIMFTGVNMDEAKYAQLRRALILKISAIASRHYSWLGRTTTSEESVISNSISEDYATLYTEIEKEYMEHSYQNWKHDFVSKMEKCVRNSELQLFCWAVAFMFRSGLGVENRKMKVSTLSYLNLCEDKEVTDIVTDRLIKLVSEYSAEDSLIWLESEELGIVWIVKPESVRFDGCIRIGEENIWQLRYFVADVIAGCDSVWDSLRKSAADESVHAVDKLNKLASSGVGHG